MLLETDKKGTPNWVFASAKKAEKESSDNDDGDAGDAALPTVNLVELRDIHLTWKDGQSGDSKIVKISKLIGQADGASSPLDFELVAALNDSAITASGKLGPLAERFLARRRCHGKNCWQHRKSNGSVRYGVETGSERKFCRRYVSTCWCFAAAAWPL